MHDWRSKQKIKQKIRNETNILLLDSLPFRTHRTFTEFHTISTTEILLEPLLLQKTINPILPTSSFLYFTRSFSPQKKQNHQTHTTLPFHLDFGFYAMYL
jgi:hypothetical protein